MASPTAPAQHTALRLLVDGDLVACQPADAPGPKAPTLSANLATGQVSLSEAPLLGAAGSTEVLALVGLFTFRAGAVLAAVTEAEQVATLYGAPVFRVAATRLLQPARPAFDAGETRLLRYLADALNPRGSGRNLFFAYQADLTLHAQALADVLASPAARARSIAARADKRFFWNRVMAAPLMGAGADAFVLPMIVGSVGQATDVPASAHGRRVSLCVSLIARRGLDRAGTRHWRRGADAQGAAANFVETEQLVSADGGGVVASYVQVRGSIPLLWTQIPDIKYKPPTRLLDGPPSSAAFDAHMDALLGKYKGVACINLVNQHGSEGALEAAFAREARRYASTRSAALTYTAFDFHKECGATNYARLSRLWARIQPEAAAFGAFVTGGSLNRRQDGVFRTNCIDCLDRTNVVQGMLGRHALEALLVDLGVLGAGEGLADALPQVEARFKALWADHGDDVGRQYAGTGALKSGFTRTGKRGLSGLVDDGAKSCVRYFLNNFRDGRKQDALDLLGGAYAVKPGVALHFPAQHSPLLPLALALLALGYALTGLGAAAGGGLIARAGGSHTAGGAGLVGAVGGRIVAPLLLAAGLLAFVRSNGRWLVDRPQLCPHLANTVAAGPGQAKPAASARSSTAQS